MNKEQPGRRANQFVRLTGEFLLRKIGGETVDIAGVENIPPGRAINAFNHMGIIEIIPVMAHGLKSRIMSKAENFKNPLARFILEKLGFFAVNRGEADSGALDKGVDALMNDYQFGIAPEETRGREKLGNRRQLKKGHRGIIWIAQQAAERLSQALGKDIEIPIAPWAIWGGTEWFIPEIDVAEIPFGERLVWKPQQIHVRIGEPIYVDKRKLTKQEQYDKADEVMIAIRNMLPPEYHGYYRQDLVNYRQEARKTVIPRIKRALQYIPALQNTTLAGYKVLNEYYPVYKTAADRFGIPWHLLWMMHHAQTRYETVFKEEHSVFPARFGAMGRIITFEDNNRIAEILRDPQDRPFYTIPMGEYGDWGQIMYAAERLHKDTELACTQTGCNRQQGLRRALENYVFFSDLPEEVIAEREENFAVFQAVFPDKNSPLF